MSCNSPWPTPELRAPLRSAGRRRALGLLAVSLTGLVGTQKAHAQGAAPPELQGRWPTAKLQGQARLRFLGLSVYDIRLWTPAAAVKALTWPTNALALELVYARYLKGSLIADRSLQEMRRSGPIDEPTAERWRQAMVQHFPDVQAGDRLTGLFEPGRGAHFFFNAAARGSVLEADFAQRFFAIWLGADTSEPRLRDELFGAP